MSEKEQDRLEILSVDLLQRAAPLVAEFQTLSKRLGLSMGWHYLLDFAWTVERLAPVSGMKVLDAGAGTGLMQWWLAGHGVDVISADRIDRSALPARFRRAYRIAGLRPGDLAAPAKRRLADYLRLLLPRYWSRYPRGLLVAARRLSVAPRRTGAGGTVLIYTTDLSRMAQVPDNSADAIVSISALEHNTPAGLRLCVAELIRILKPGGMLLATVAGARDEDWFHEPSEGWCYTERTLRDLFGLADDCISNFGRYDELFDTLRGCTQLREALDPAYFRSGRNGMPWGRWDPRYVPVGVLRVKTTEAQR